MAPLNLFLSGDVMTGRGIDQVLAHPGDPRLHEDFVRSATGYVELAERVSGPIARPVSDDHVWGDALEELQRVNPAARIVNLETAITRSDDWVDKGINYRMHPDNVGCLTVARIDCCALANNHVLDWGPAGLVETLEVLARAGIATAGAGRDAQAASTPATVDGKRGRVLVFALGVGSSGIPSNWQASAAAPGIAFVDRPSERNAARISDHILGVRGAGDVVVVSIHWGGNWGFRVPADHRAFAHHLIDQGAADLVHGHSSHHPLGFEVHRGKLVLYGCGDLINDYEGIGGYEQYGPDVRVLYFPTVAPDSGELTALEMVALHSERFRLARATPAATEALVALLEREGRAFGTGAELVAPARIAGRWAG